ncbi:potassium transporter TrkG [uncultured Methanoregula sp.]|uniref:TrkH family potassium uptake protein n=1 Tax=uncultured Methanoregula sp. TaxID=1005933 RepID=UPI002AAB2C51|nr:potassium transporter TrkG [uncultured Methanoregula sp.]
MQRFSHLTTIVADLGDIFFFTAPLTILPLIVAVLFAEWGMLLPMASVPAIFFGAGILLRLVPRHERGVRLSTALCSVALFWFCCALISGLPFVLGLHMGFLDSLFEGMAGWTGTAYTMLASLDTTPHTLIFWRSYMQWIGGLGIIAFSIALASNSGLFRSKILRSESRDEPLMPSIMHAGRAIWKIYGILTFFAIGLILFTGLSLWESVNLALSAISTGGFTPHNGGILYYNSTVLELILIPIMIAGALPFKLYYLITENRRWSLFGDEQVKLFFLFLAAGVVVLTYDLIFFGNLELLPALQQGLFMTVSSITTTGFQVANIHTWASVTVLFLAMLTFIGGAAGSTAGGIKLDRIAFAYRALTWWFHRLYVSGKILIPFRIEGRVIPRTTAELLAAKNMLVIILSVVIIFISTLVIIQFHLTTYTVTEIVFSVVSAFSTCGLNAGYVSPDMPVISKWIIIIVMWIGRLEVIPVVMLFLALFRGSES